MYQLSENIKITPELALKYISKHNLGRERFDTLYDYYIGNHSILSRTKGTGASNNRLVCNHAKYITDCTTGYFMGSPVQYLPRGGKDISAV
ncbi:MAG: phage portal protein, partial [Ruminiclostridium sp.]|nr:phage portal protein [Ruminiclostridium sp.]